MQISATIRRGSKIVFSTIDPNDSGLKSDGEGNEEKMDPNLMSAVDRGDFPEIMAKRSFIIAKAHLLYLLRKEEDKLESEVSDNSSLAANRVSQ